MARIDDKPAHSVRREVATNGNLGSGEVGSEADGREPDREREE